MLVEVLPTLESITENKLKGRIAIVVDVLRATSTMVTALAHGCREIIPVISVQQARELAIRLEPKMCQNDGARARDCKSIRKDPCQYSRGTPRHVILGGERGGSKINDFPLGNSPLEYTPQTVAQKTLILTTTNGTAAICRTACFARTVLIGSLLNARAVARAVLHAGQDVTIICAGTAGRFCLEDAVSAGVIVNEMTSSKKVQILNDWARIVFQLALSCKENPARGIYDAYNAQRLAGKGRYEDVKWCAKLNNFDIVPVFKNGKIIVGESKIR